MDVVFLGLRAFGKTVWEDKNAAYITILNCIVLVLAQ